MPLTQRQRRYFEHKMRREAFASEMQHRTRAGVIAGLSGTDLDAIGDAIQASRPAWCTERGYMCWPCGEREAEPCAFKTYVDAGTRCALCGDEI